MINTNSEYVGPFDREFVQQMASVGAKPSQQINQPIIPVNELGITVVEKDPRSGANILQNVQAAIRAGASTIQLIMTTSSQSAIGGRPKAYGKEVRDAIREAAHANELNIAGLEMPTSSHTNLSGFDNRKGFDEKKRYEDMEEIRDAMQFVADVAEGGGVDIWSQEFPRTIFDLDKHKGTQWEDKFFEHPKEKEEAIKHLVDKRTGDIIKSIRIKDVIPTFEWKVNDKTSLICSRVNSLLCILFFKFLASINCLRCLSKTNSYLFCCPISC